MNQFDAVRCGDLSTLRNTLTMYNINDRDRIGHTVLELSVLYKQNECVDYCLAMGAMKNTKYHMSGWTPLHLASRHGLIHIIYSFLRAGALIDVLDNKNRTPLDIAISHNQPQAVVILIDHGAAIRVSAPDWIIYLKTSREQCRLTAILLIGVHKFRPRGDLTQGQDKNVLRLIAKHIWSMRME